ncbi:TPA: hypothetical protein DIV49_01695 [Candidatus Saccharibacteria bacterium]|nr:hypothetical protein [Candidatus Saccharibacteria bacterium]HRJ91053.1 hypothetical protein [Candidatus Saccharibacteria bacterium]
MSENLKPVDYEPLRLYTFVSRAWHGRNIAELKPPREVNRAAFADAILGRFFDDSENFAGIDKNLRLQQGEYAIDYLSGKPFDELQQDLDELKLRDTDVIEYALQVAGLGARSFRDEDKADESPTAHDGVIRPKAFAEQKRILDEMPQSLREAITWLFESGYITKSSHAQCLLLLFEQSETNVDEEIKRSAKHWAARYVQDMLKDNKGVPFMSRKYLEIIVKRTFEDTRANVVSGLVEELTQQAEKTGSNIPKGVIRQRLDEAILVGVASFFGQYPIILHSDIVRDSTPSVRLDA